MPSWNATAAVTFNFGPAASDSTSRTIPAAAAVYLAVTLFDATGHTLAATIAGAAPTESYQAVVGTDGNYQAVFVGAPSGSQTVFVGTGSAGDGWICGYRGVDNPDTANPLDGEVTDSASPASISVTSTSDGLVVGMIQSADNTLTTSDTEIMELAPGGYGFCLGVASAPGTGGSVSIDWANGGSLFLATAINLRHTALVTANLTPAIMRCGVPAPTLTNQPSAVLSGTALDGITEADVVAGGKTMVITVGGTTWIPN